MIYQIVYVWTVEDLVTEAASVQAESVSSIFERSQDMRLKT